MKIVISFLHKELEPKKPKKAQAHEVEGHDQPKIEIKSELKFQTVLVLLCF